MLEGLEREIRDYERRMSKIARERKPAAARLQQVNGVGPITSLGFVLTVADPSRFPHSRTVGSWVGLAPRVQASGDRDLELSISKTGDGYLRRLLVQSAQYMLGPFGMDTNYVLSNSGEVVAQARCVCQRVGGVDSRQRPVQVLWCPPVADRGPGGRAG